MRFESALAFTKNRIVTSRQLQPVVGRSRYAAEKKI
jgi:hypothetical protein